MAGAYDIISILTELEDSLIRSMQRNLKRHLSDELAEGFDWTQWQAEMLQGIAQYRQQNQALIQSSTGGMYQLIDAMLRSSYNTGETRQEAEILRALKKGYKRTASVSASISSGFFQVNANKLNALVASVQGEFRKATASILRKSEDIYRQTIFRSAAQLNTGGITVAQAIDQASKDFLAQGIQNIRYRDGRQVNITSYAEMALRTSNLRANIQGAAAKRDEWGICTVKMSEHGSACPKCLAWQGKVYYDDVFGAVPVPDDGRFPLLSTAIAGGALHPNCRNGIHTWFEGINEDPKPMTQAEIQEASRRYDLEQQQRYCERNVRKYKRLKLGSLDEENVRKYAAKEQEWRHRLKTLTEENSDVLRLDNKRLKVYGVDASSDKIAEKALTSSGVGGIIFSESGEVLTEIKQLGYIDAKRLESEFGKLQTDEIIITNERIDHIQQRHPEDFMLFEKYGVETATNPDIIIKDEKNQGTVFMIKKLGETNLNVVVRLVLCNDDEGRKNSIMTFYRIRDKNLKKLEKKNKVLYKKE